MLTTWKFIQVRSIGICEAAYKLAATSRHTTIINKVNSRNDLRFHGSLRNKRTLDFAGGKDTIQQIPTPVPTPVDHPKQEFLQPTPVRSRPCTFPALSSFPSIQLFFWSTCTCCGALFGHGRGHSPAATIHLTSHYGWPWVPAVRLRVTVRLSWRNVERTVCVRSKERFGCLRVIEKAKTTRRLSQKVFAGCKRPVWQNQENHSRDIWNI